MKATMKSLLKNLFEKSCLPAYVICKEPLIMVTYWKDFYENISLFNNALEGKKTYLIVQLGWHISSPELMEDFKEQYVAASSKIGFDCKFTFLSNSIEDSKSFKKLGLKYIFSNQNAFIDEKRLVLKDCSKVFDCVYLARISPFKRHMLASKLSNLLLIGGFHDREKGYLKSILANVNFKEWLLKVPYNKVSKTLAKAKVGLCLSAEEGAMFASTEYLLSGIPVVSTVSLGGREVFLDDSNSIIVKDDPLLVKKAVDGLAQKELCPQTLRKSTIDKMKEHRNVFIDCVQTIIDKEGGDIDFKERFSAVFVHKWGLRSTSLSFRFFFNRYYFRS